MNKNILTLVVAAFFAIIITAPVGAQEDGVYADTGDTTYVDEFSAVGDSATTTEAEILNYSTDDFTEEKSGNNTALIVVMIAAVAAAGIGFAVRKKKSA